MPKAEQSTFADKAASLGLPVAIAAKAHHEVVTVCSNPA